MIIRLKTQRDLPRDSQSSFDREHYGLTPVPTTLLNQTIVILERHALHEERLHAAMRQIAKESDRLQTADQIIKKVKGEMEHQRTFELPGPLDEVSVEVLRQRMFGWESKLKEASSEVGSVTKALVVIYQKAFSE